MALHWLVAENAFSECSITHESVPLPYCAILTALSLNTNKHLALLLCRPHLFALSPSPCRHVAMPPSLAPPALAMHCSCYSAPHQYTRVHSLALEYGQGPRAYRSSPNPLLPYFAQAQFCVPRILARLTRLKACMPLPYARPRSRCSAISMPSSAFKAVISRATVLCAAAFEH